MILALRQRHRRIVAILGVVLPLAFIAGLVARRPPVILETLPPQLIAPASPFTAVKWQRHDLFTNSVSVHLLRETPDSGRFAVGFEAAANFVKPDLLVYWSTDKASSSGKLFAESRLLGAFDPFTALPLPDNVPGGRLILYSLADHEIVDVSQLINF